MVVCFMVSLRTGQQERTYDPIQVPTIDDDISGAIFILHPKRVDNSFPTAYIVEGLADTGFKRCYCEGELPECGLSIKRSHGQNNALIVELETENPEHIRQFAEYLERNRDMMFTLGDVQVIPISKYPDERVPIDIVPSTEPFDVKAAYAGLVSGRLPPWKNAYFSKYEPISYRYRASERFGNMTYECLVLCHDCGEDQVAWENGTVTIRDDKDFVTVNQREQVSMSDGIDATKGNLLVELIKAAAKAK